MIRLSTDDNTPLRVDQWCETPTVYLDHWAIRKLSENKLQSSRFVTAVRAKNGTVALSWLNLVEFSRVSDNDQVRAAGEMVHNLFPNLFFMEINPFEVIKNENRLLAGDAPSPPHADKELLKEFFLLNQTTTCPYDAVQLFQIAQESDRSGRLDSLVDTVLEWMTVPRENSENDTNLKRILRKPARTSRIQAGTRDILRETELQILLDCKAPMRRNDAIDLLHTVVPVSYCDTVLLDGHWRALVERVSRRLASANAAFPVAKAYSGKGDGVDKFLSFLEGGA